MTASCLLGVISTYVSLEIAGQQPAKHGFWGSGLASLVMCCLLNYCLGRSEQGYTILSILLELRVKSNNLLITSIYYPGSVKPSISFQDYSKHLFFYIGKGVSNNIDI